MKDLENLQIGLDNFEGALMVYERMDKKKANFESLINLYANLEVLIDKGFKLNYYNEIIYPAQSLQARTMILLKEWV